MAEDQDGTAELKRVTAELSWLRLEQPEFGAAWAAQLQAGADRAAAVVAGERMAGATEGSVPDTVLSVPVPSDAARFPPELVVQVFGAELAAEVARRLALLTGPGGIG